MTDYKGVIIEESLKNKSVLKQVKIISTKVEQVTKEHQSAEKQWTLHTVVFPGDSAKRIADRIAESIKDRWYADFKNDTHHYIVFRHRVFFVDRTSKERYDEAKAYGISLGIPEYQVDFHPDIAEWER